jgi:hypothetical protein
MKRSVWLGLLLLISSYTHASTIRLVIGGTSMVGAYYIGNETKAELDNKDVRERFTSQGIKVLQSAQEFLGILAKEHKIDDTKLSELRFHTKVFVNENASVLLKGTAATVLGCFGIKQGSCPANFRKI